MTEKVKNEHDSIANAFLNLTRGGSGDWTKEKYDQPDMTDAELDDFIKRAKAETEARFRK